MPAGKGAVKAHVEAVLQVWDEDSQGLLSQFQGFHLAKDTNI